MMFPVMEWLFMLFNQNHSLKKRAELNSENFSLHYSQIMVDWFFHYVH